MTAALLWASRSTNRVLDVSGCTRQVTYTTNRTGAPGQLQFSPIAPGGLPIAEGDAVRFTVDGTLVFYGWVFSVSVNRWGELDVTCYDRLRYLKASASYAFYGQTAGQILQQIAGDFLLATGEIADTGAPIPSLIAQEQTCLDIIGQAVQQTLLATGAVYVLYDNGTGLSLQRADRMASHLLIGEGSQLLDFTHTSNIDQQTYNRIKLARPNQETGKADVYIAEDSSTMERWGLLQLYRSVDGAENGAQIAAQAAAMLAYYNRPLRSFKATCLGVVGLRAGQIVYLRVPEVKELEGGRYALLERVSHTFENEAHTMEIETLAL